MTSQTQPEVDEIKVLFPEERIGPYILRPWTLTQFLMLSGAILRMLEGFLGLGLTEANAPDFLDRPVAELMPAIAPIVPEVIGVTLGLNPGEVAEINLGLQAALGLKILIFNRENQAQIKNFLAGFFGDQKSPANSIP